MSLPLENERLERYFLMEHISNPPLPKTTNAPKFEVIYKNHENVSIIWNEWENITVKAYFPSKLEYRQDLKLHLKVSLGN